MQDDKEKIIGLLRKKLEEIPQLLSLNHGSNAEDNPIFINRKQSITRMLGHFTGDNNSSYVKDFNCIYFCPTSIYAGMPDSEYEKECEIAFEKGLETAKYTLQNIIEEFEMLDIQGQDNGKDKENVTNIFNISQNQTQSQSINLDVKTIFKNQLSENQLNELENIIKEKDKNKFQKFLESLGIGLSVEMLKTLMLSIFF